MRPSFPACGMRANDPGLLGHPHWYSGTPGQAAAHRHPVPTYVPFLCRYTWKVPRDLATVTCPAATPASPPPPSPSCCLESTSPVLSIPSNSHKEDHGQ
jgi:hypothetical protein